MKIEVTVANKSVGIFSWNNIPNLSIITGLNGAGKSQLLQYIHSKPNIVVNDDDSNYSQDDITFLEFRCWWIS
ncbi:MAG TPA: hypothetical protein PLS10_02390 [Chitinophagales bacterium]|nr:hypothetical protein [Chitinophagales bacterium]